MPNLAKTLSGWMIPEVIEVHEPVLRAIRADYYGKLITRQQYRARLWELNKAIKRDLANPLCVTEAWRKRRGMRLEEDQ